MFLSLLLVTFVTALAVSFIVAMLFSRSMRRILEKVVSPELAGAWHRYVIFALYVVGVSGGVRIGALEQYVAPATPQRPVPVLTQDRWILELYRTIVETLQATAWMLLITFLFLLMAYVVARGLELRGAKHATAAAG